MPFVYFDITKPIIWKKDDYFSCQQHDLIFENGIGKTTATELLYGGKVLDTDSDGKIIKALLERHMKDGVYAQHTLPLKKTESLISETKDGLKTWETYEPIYENENPTQRYLFTITSGARIE